MFRKSIASSLRQVEAFSNTELDVILSIVGESNWRQLTAGAHCQNEQGQMLTILGFSKNPFSCTSNNYYKLKSEINTQKMFTFGSSSSGSGSEWLYGLYFDSSNPERQEIISVPPREVNPMLDLAEFTTI